MEPIKKQAASIEAEHITQLSCAGCQKTLDVSHLPPFSQIKCPECGAEQIVPAKFGGFLLVKQLGAGGMGVIYRAVDRELGRNVALKVMKRSLGDNPEFVRSFKHEAQAAAALNHRNVVQIYSFGQHNGQPYIVMELVDGGKLDDLIAAPGGVDEIKALAIHLEVTEGLMAASDVGLVHGDVKPANILFGKNGEAKVVDFGLASYIGEGQKDGAVWGTPYYIAPEKARGKKADFRSDIYSLGATLFHVLTGKPPFDGPTSNDVVMARLNAPAPDVRSINQAIHPQTASMIARMLEMDPAMRYPSYPALLIDMRNSLEAARKPLSRAMHVAMPLPIKATETTLKTWMKKLNLKIVLAASGALVLAAAGTAGIVLHLRHQERMAEEKRAKQELAAALEGARTTADRIDNLAALISEMGEGYMPLADRADKIAASISRVDDPTALIMDLTDNIAGGMNESQDLHSQAAFYICELEKATDHREAKRMAGLVEDVFSKLVAIQAMVQESGEVAKENLPAAIALQKRDLEKINRARAEQARIEAERRKREAEQAEAKKREEALKLKRPLIIQQELDLIDQCRGANSVMISQKRFAAAARAFAAIRPRITLEETRAAYDNVSEAYAEIVKFKTWLCGAINKTPCKGCWPMGENARDIVKADDETGITVALGAAGTTMITWETMSLAQLLKIVNFYAESSGLSDPQRAILFKQTALLCYESGVFKSAETYANAAYRANPDLLADLNRLMPGIVTTE